MLSKTPIFGFYKIQFIDLQFKLVHLRNDDDRLIEISIGDKASNQTLTNCLIRNDGNEH